jgi:hypothetical protein
MLGPFLMALGLVDESPQMYSWGLTLRPHLIQMRADTDCFLTSVVPGPWRTGLPQGLG